MARWCCTPRRKRPLGGPLALVRDGDMIELDVAGRRLHLDVSEAELAAPQGRMDAHRCRPALPPAAAIAKLFVDHVLQADRGCDFDFLVGKRGADVPRQSH